MNSRSEELFEKAKTLMPGGVNSPVRAYKSVGGGPLFIKSASSSKIYDVDGNEYIDYVLSWGPMILGHAHPKVVSAVKKAADRGTSYGAPTAEENRLAQMVLDAYPAMDLVRFVSSGTEATMSALRLARGSTGKNGIIKFDGCYHGHSDSLLVKAGSGVATLGIPGSPGVPASLAKHTYNAVYNDLSSVEKIFQDVGDDVAAVIVEPVAANMGVVLPKRGFLKGLRELCTRFGAILVFDEVITGFRISLGGAQGFWGVDPDLTCLGKIIGGGMPVGAYGGRRDLMEQISPSGPVYQAGTLSGNPVAMAAGIATLEVLSQPGTYETLDKKGSILEHGLQGILSKYGLPYTTTRIGSLLCLFFTGREPSNFDDVKTCDTEKFSRYFHKMLDRGINLAPSQFEAAFVSLAHSQEDLEKTIQAMEASLAG